MEGKPCNLIETVATDIATNILQDYRQVKGLKVSVQKPHVALDGVVKSMGTSHLGLHSIPNIAQLTQFECVFLAVLSAKRVADLRMESARGIMVPLLLQQLLQLRHLQGVQSETGDGHEWIRSTFFRNSRSKACPREMLRAHVLGGADMQGICL